MFKFKLRKLKKQSLIKRINEIIDGTGYEIECFIIDYKCFGNIVLKLICVGKKNIKIITDRGDIYFNDMMICYNNYHVIGFDDTPLKVLECLSNHFKSLREEENGVESKESRIINVSTQFYSSSRKTFPCLIKNKSCSCYRPHIVIENTNVYLGIEFIDSSATTFDIYGNSRIKLLYDGIDYSGLIKGVKFFIMEGSKKVGDGVVI